MIKCKSQAEFEFEKYKSCLLWGSVVFDERKKIIYLPEDKIYQELFLNRKVRTENETGN